MTKSMTDIFWDEDNKYLTVKMYSRPRGFMREICMRNIEPEDIDFFERNDLVVSIEELAGDFIVYARPRSDVDEESEVLTFAKGRTCEQTMSELREICTKAYGVV